MLKVCFGLIHIFAQNKTESVEHLPQDSPIFDLQIKGKEAPVCDRSLFLANNFFSGGCQLIFIKASLLSIFFLFPL